MGLVRSWVQNLWYDNKVHGTILQKFQNPEDRVQWLIGHLPGYHCCHSRLTPFIFVFQDEKRAENWALALHSNSVQMSIIDTSQIHPSFISYYDSILSLHRFFGAADISMQSIPRLGRIAWLPFCLVSSHTYSEECLWKHWSLCNHHNSHLPCILSPEPRNIGLNCNPLISPKMKPR